MVQAKEYPLDKTVQLCLEGNRLAQRRLYEQYADAMYNTCLRMLRHESDAQDVLQLSFVDVFRNLNRFRGESTIGAWIKRIVINHCINFLKKKRLQWQSLEEQHRELPAPINCPSEKPYSVEGVKKAIFELPDGYRIVLSMYLLEGFDHEEIANYLNISISTSKSQYSRAKAKLRKLLQEAV